MISCKTLLHQSKESAQRFLKIDPNEGPVCFQLSGSDPLELSEAVKRVTAEGAALIDLNCGCPVKKIRSKGVGSKLLTDAMQLYKLITAMKQSTHVPVSIKIRVEIAEERFNQEVAKVVQEAGADFLVVHGRHWTQHYETPCRHEEIAFFVNELSIPVIGNGDIADEDSLRKMFATGCAGVMIGRAGVGQPWLIGQLIASICQEKFIFPVLPQVGSIFLTHVIELAALLNNEKFAILQARKFAKYYARPLINRAEYCEAVNACETLFDLKRLTDEYFGT